LLIEATFDEEELQVTVEETSLLVPSPKLPIAVNCWVFVNCNEAFEGVTEMATKEFASGKNLPQLTVIATMKSKDASVQRCARTDAGLHRLMPDRHFDMLCTAS